MIATDWAPIIIATGGLVSSLGAAVAAIISARRIGAVKADVIAVRAEVVDLKTNVEGVSSSGKSRTAQIDVIGGAVAAIQRSVSEVKKDVARVELNTNSITERLANAKLAEGTAIGTAVGRREITEENRILADEAATGEASRAQVKVDGRSREDFVDEKSRTVDEKARAVDEKARVVDEKARIVDEKARSDALEKGRT